MSSRHENAVRPESYVLRIYRHDPSNRRSIVGVIEAVETGWQKPFRSFDELADILAAWGAHSRAPRSLPRSPSSRGRAK
jgi:hypothetical protein